MKNSTMIVCLLYITILLTSNSYAQKGKQVWEISAYTNQPNMGAVLDRVSRDTLYVFAFNDRFGIEIDSIKYLKEIKYQKGYAVSGTILGILGGGILGYVISENSANNKGLMSGIENAGEIVIGTGIGVILSGISGAAIGSSIERPRYFNFETRTIDQKKVVLLKLINEK